MKGQTMTEEDLARKLANDPKMLRLMVRLAPRKGSGIESVRISSGGRTFTLTSDDRSQFLRRAKAAKARR